MPFAIIPQPCTLKSKMRKLHIKRSSFLIEPANPSHLHIRRGEVTLARPPKSLCLKLLPRSLVLSRAALSAGSLMLSFRRTFRWKLRNRNAVSASATPAIPTNTEASERIILAGSITFIVQLCKPCKDGILSKKVNYTFRQADSLVFVRELYL